MGKRILIVEDSKNIAMMVKVCLENHGYEIVSKCDGLNAVEYVFRAHPDLILLDVLIPKMNGYLVIETLKQDENTKGIPVIMMSAKAQSDDIKKALQAGAADYLVKPFSPDTLLEKIEKFITKEG